MNEDILINVTPQETRVAVMHSGVAQELHIERSASRGLLGNIYMGKVARVLPGMQSAFVEIGLERAAFLHVADIWEERANGHCAAEPGKAAQKPIEKILSEGQPLLVQVVKDPIGTKGARLSTQISIAGRMLVHLPQDAHIGISQRIEDESGRALLLDRVKQILPAGEKGGFIIRTMAETASDAELLNDLQYLRKLWQDLREKSLCASAPSLLYQDLSLAQRVLRDFVSESTDRILIDSRENFLKLQAFARDYMQIVLARLDHYTGERPLFDLYGVEEEIEKALARRVDLKSGGYLIIDQTEAMTTIDVNTGGFVGVRNFDDTIFKTNLEAAQVIARQLRLRNLGGIIIVDFIDMEKEENQRRVLSAFEEALSADRAKMTLHPISSLGLVQMTRKRVRENLVRLLCEPCPYCDGRAIVKSATTVCYEVFREIRRRRRAGPGSSVTVSVHPDVADLLFDEERAGVEEVERATGTKIVVRGDPGLHREQFEVSVS